MQADHAIARCCPERSGSEAGSGPAFSHSAQVGMPAPSAAATGASHELRGQAAETVTLDQPPQGLVPERANQGRVQAS